MYTIFDVFREPMAGANRTSFRGSYALGGATASVVAGGTVIAVKWPKGKLDFRQAGWYRECRASRPAGDGVLFVMKGEV